MNRINTIDLYDEEFVDINDMPALEAFYMNYARSMLATVIHDVPEGDQEVLSSLQRVALNGNEQASELYEEMLHAGVQGFPAVHADRVEHRRAA